MYVVIIAGLLSIAGGIAIFDEKRLSRNTVLSITIGALLFFGIRFHLGPDMSNYYYVFVRVSSPIQDAMKYELQRNIGFNILIYYAKIILKTYPRFIFLVSLICFGLIGWVIIKKSRQCLFSLVILIAGGVLEVYISSGIRQAISMALFLFAFYRYLPERKFLLYYTFSILAALFHDAGIVTLFIPLLLLAEPFIRTHRKQVAIITALITGGMLLLCFVIIPSYSDIIRKALPFMSVKHLLEYYFSVRPEVSLIGIAMELCFLIATLFLWFQADIDHNNDFEFLQLLTILFSIVIYIGFSGIPVVSRVSDFLQIIFIIVLPEWISLIKERKWKMLCYLASIAMHFVLLWVDLKEKCPHIILPNDQPCTIETYPYVTVFDPVTAVYLEKQ